MPCPPPPSTTHAQRQHSLPSVAAGAPAGWRPSPPFSRCGCRRRPQQQHAMSSPACQASPQPATAAQPVRGPAAQPLSPACKAAASPQPATAAQPVLLDAVSAPPLLAQLDTLILDQDGVLWRGQDLIPNAIEALQVFRAAGKRLLFVTNNSSRSRRAYCEKFQSLGFTVRPDEIVSSSYAAAAYLKSINFKQARLAAGRAPCVLLMGSSGMREELEAVGLQVVDADEAGLPLMDNVGSMLDMKLDQRVGAVVLGWHARFDYSKLVYATALLREQQCLFIATNLDHADVISSSSSNGVPRVMPGTGSLVAALQVASGVTPVNVGKGGPWLLPYLMQAFNLDPSRTAVMGDRLDTDIALGKQGGLVTLLPLTGVTSLAEAMAAPPGDAPDFTLSSVADLAGL